MGLFSPKKKKVVRAVEDIGPVKRTVYDYVDINAYDRERNGRDEHVGPSTQRREVNVERDSKPSFLGLRRRKKQRERSFLESGSDEADKHADLLQR